jgi:hypothetical protein
LWARRSTQAAFAASWMVAKNCKYDRFGHVHFSAILKRYDCAVCAIEIIKGFIDRGVKKQATCPVKIYSPFQFGISWGK